MACSTLGTLSNTSEHTASVCLTELWENTELFYPNTYLAEGSDGKVSSCHFNISWQKTRLPSRYIALLYCFQLMVLNECLMTEHGVSADLEAAIRAGHLHQEHLSASICAVIDGERVIFPWVPADAVPFGGSWRSSILMTIKCLSFTECASLISLWLQTDMPDSWHLPWWKLEKWR